MQHAMCTVVVTTTLLLLLLVFYSGVFRQIPCMKCVKCAMRTDNKARLTVCSG